MAERDLLIASELATLKAEVGFLKQRLAETEAECKERDTRLERRLTTLERWKIACDKVAVKWGTILALIMGVGTYWEQIKAFLRAMRS